MLKPLSFYGEHQIDLRLGVHAVAIDRAAKTWPCLRASRWPMMYWCWPPVHGHGV
jgi:hypothetical protein